MTRFLRGLLGALVSALLVLFAHPQSRPYLTLAFTQVGENHVFGETQWIPGNRPVLPQPADRATAALWIFVGADRLAKRLDVSRNDLQKLLVVADAAAREDPNNAFWQQSAAIVLNALGEREQAVKRWVKASRATTWNDYQGERLTAIARALEEDCGMRSSWQVFAMYPYRDSSHAKVVETFARALIDRSSMSDRSGLEMRYATLLNGVLMRDGAGSFDVLQIGLGVIEMASYPSKMEADPSKRALQTARYELHNNMVQAGMVEEARVAIKAFNVNDGWAFLRGTAGADEHRRLLMFSAALVAGGPSALLAIALVALLIWGLGGLLLRKPKLRAIFGMPYAPIVGFAAGVALFASLHLALVAIAATAVFAFAAFAPGQQRSNPAEDLGPFFRFVLVVIALALTFLLGAAFVGYASPGFHLLPLIGVTTDYLGGSGALIGLAALSLGLLLLVSPAWALVRKVQTPWVLALGARDLGKGLFLAAASLCVLFSLASLYFDPRLYKHGEAILEKEPVYYYFGNEALEP